MDEDKVTEAETSPVPEAEEKTTLTFSEAMAEVSLGKRIKREAWPEGEYCFFNGDFLAIQRLDKLYDGWIISKGDACESDWVSF